jgi:hypothetical protein
MHLLSLKRKEPLANASFPVPWILEATGRDETPIPGHGMNRAVLSGES